MNNFNKPVEYIKVNNGIILTSPVKFYYNDNLTGEYLIIPEGHFFNGATIPKLIQKIFKFDPFNHYLLAATIVHDALVGEFNNPIPTMPSNKILSWKECTKWFNKALKVRDENNGMCPTFYRRLFVNVVRLYGIIRLK